MIGNEAHDRLIGWCRRSVVTRKRQSALRKSLSERKPWEDEVLREVYAVRDAYAAEHGCDLDRIYADLKRREARSRLRRAEGGPVVGRRVTGSGGHMSKRVEVPENIVDGVSAQKQLQDYCDGPNWCGHPSS